MCWADMTFADRGAWFASEAEQLARARGAFVLAAETWAKAARASGALERDSLSAEQYLGQILDTADGALASEVQEWFGC